MLFSYSLCWSNIDSSLILILVFYCSIAHTVSIPDEPELSKLPRVGEEWEFLSSSLIPSKPREREFLDVQLLDKAGLVSKEEIELLFCRADTLRLWEELSAWSSPTEKHGLSVVGLVRGPPGTGT
jgi:hypothetical protein